MAATSRNTDTPLEIEGRALVAARTVWFMVMAAALIVIAIALPSWVRLMGDLGRPPDGISSETTLLYKFLNVLAALVAFVVLAGSLGMSVLLFRRTAVSRIAYFTSLYLIYYSTITLGPLEGAALTLTGSSAIASWANYFDYVILFAAWLFWIFPNGRFVPRWTRFLILPTALIVILWTVTGTSPNSVQTPSGFPQQASQIIIGLLWFTIPVLQIYRYWRVSNPVERQQARWVMVGIVLWIALVVFAGLSSESDTVFTPVAGVLWFVGLSMLPVSLTVAILRYNLWAVDVIIRRTLTYGLITLLLAGTYYGGVVLMQSIFERLTGQQSPLAVVASTLVIAALFNPLRKRIQSFIDRRFDRRKYDAQQTLEHFGDIARDEVDLEQIEQALITTINDTMQPESVSLWLTSTNQ